MQPQDNPLEVDPQLQFLAASQPPGGLPIPPMGMSGFLDSLNLQSFTADQQAELLASVQAAQLQGNHAGQLQQVLMTQLQKFQLQNAQKELLQIQKQLADPAQAYQQTSVATSGLNDMYMNMGKPDDKAVISDDRAQYKQTLGNFLARDTKNKKGAGKVGGNDYSSGETDSGEEEIYTKKIGGSSGKDDKKV